MVLETPGPAEAHPLVRREDVPAQPGPGEVRLRVEACGVCRTDLHVVEGDLPPQANAIVPGHEIVGRVEACGDGAAGLMGKRVGVAWLHRSCGDCRFCRAFRENLCLTPVFTGWHVPGGYAETCTAPSEFVYPLPEDVPARELAPLLCAGIIGYRAVRRTEVQSGQRLGLYGFGGSAHIAIQVARHFGCEVYVFTRGRKHRELAEALGAVFVGDATERPPRPLDAAVLFAPAGELVPVALENLDRGGVLAIAGIHLSPVPVLDYARHLFQERSLRSVTANTRSDGRALLALAREIPIRTRTQLYPLADANRALVDLKQGRVDGAAVLEAPRYESVSSVKQAALNRGEA